MKKNYLRESVYACSSRKQLKKVLKKLFKDYGINYTGDCAICKVEDDTTDYFRVAYSENCEQACMFGDLLDVDMNKLVWVDPSNKMAKKLVDVVSRYYQCNNFVVLVEREGVASEFTDAICMTIICNAIRDSSGAIFSEGKNINDEENLLDVLFKMPSAEDYPDDIDIVVEMLARNIADNPEELDNTMNTVRDRVVSRIAEIQESSNTMES